MLCSAANGCEQILQCRGERDLEWDLDRLGDLLTERDLEYECDSDLDFLRPPRFGLENKNST